MHVLQVLRRPVVTEKSTLMQERSKYVFEVAPGANKAQVKEAMERAFGVKVIAVNIANTKGEVRRMGGARIIKMPTVKKAVVTLRQGDTIQIFEGA